MPIGPWKKSFDAGLVAQWTIAWAVISDKISQAFVAGAFATPQTTAEYFHDNWWTILISGVVAFIFGTGARIVQRQSANGSVPLPAAQPQGDSK